MTGMTEASPDTPPSDRAPIRLSYIDACRAIAVCLVMFVHCGQWFPTTVPGLKVAADLGQFGVQLFFVASAFTIASAVKRSTYANFMGRRFLRIAPLYFLAIPLYAVIAYAAMRLGKDTPFLKEGFAGFTSINILANMTILHGLYPPANNSVVPGGWSIGAEWLFYLATPLLAGPRLRASTLIAIALLLAFATHLFGLFAPWRWSQLHSHGFLYYSIFNNLTPFALGIAYYRYREALSAWPKVAWAVVLAVVIALLVLCLSGRVPDRIAVTVTPMLAGMGSLAVVLMVSTIRRVPALIVRLGETSYSSYILHFAVIQAIAFASRAVLHKPLDLLAAAPLVLVTTFVLSNLTYTVIEQPFIALSKRWFSSGRASSQDVGVKATA